MDTTPKEFKPLLSELQKIRQRLEHLLTAIKEHQTAVENIAQAYHREQEATPTVNAELHLPKSVEDTITKKAKQRDWQKAMTFLTAMAFIATSWYACEAHRQTPMIQESADAARDAAKTAVAANRSWIVPDFPPQHKKVIEEANLEWRNVGKTPAIAVSTWKEYFTGEFPKRLRTCSEMETVASREQKQPFVSEGGRYEIGLDHAPAWVGQQPIFIHGCVWYTDVSSSSEKSSEFFYDAFQGKYEFPISEGISLFFDNRPFVYK